MDVEFFPSVSHGTFSAPPSKSMAHRFIICGSLSRGESRIDNISLSEDIKHTVDCMRNLGAEIAERDGGLDILGTEALRPQGVFDCGESASTLRFILPLCLLQDEKCVLTGKPWLFERPLGAYEKLFRKENIFFERDKNRIIVKGRLKGGKYTVDGSVSSQFVSGLLFALPLSERDSELEILSPVSRPYIDMTLGVLSLFGITAERSGNTLLIPGNQSCKCGSFTCEGDYSNSAVFFALKHLGGQINIQGLDENSLQGDRVCDGLLTALSEKSQVIDVSDCPDLAPVLFSFAAVKNGGVFTGTERLRRKESDRLENMKDGLSEFGAELLIGDDSVTVPAAHIKKPAKPVDGRNDHRIAMAMSMLLSLTGGILRNGECVNKSMPDFFEKLREVNIKNRYIG